MVEIQVPTDSQWYNLFELGSLDSLSYIVSNTSNASVRLIQSTTQPQMTERGWLLNPSQTVLVHASDNPCWIRCTSTPAHVNVQPVTGTIAPFINADLPHDMYTSNTEPFRRIRVDVGQTGLYEGREFRLVRKVSITQGTPLVFKFVSEVDFILFEQTLNCSVGDIEFYAWRSTQGTEGGTFTPLPVAPIGKNISSFYREYDGQRYASQVTISTGGTFTPTNTQQYVDYDRAKTAGATAQQVSVAGGNDSVRYLAAGTYYLILTSLDATSIGRFALAWEERLVSTL